MTFSLFKKLISKKTVSSFTTFGLLMCFGFAFSGQVMAEHKQTSSDHSRYLEGKKTFGKYCSRCHGENADGRGKVAPLFIKLKTPRPSNFRIKFYTIRPAEYLASVIRDGGEMHSLSKSMPPFKQELSDSQIKNVVHFIKNISYHANNK